MRTISVIPPPPHSKSVRQIREKLATSQRGENRSLMNFCNLPKITLLEREQNRLVHLFRPHQGTFCIAQHSNRKYTHISLFVACTWKFSQIFLVMPLSNLGSKSTFSLSLSPLLPLTLRIFEQFRQCLRAQVRESDCLHNNPQFCSFLSSAFDNSLLQTSDTVCKMGLIILEAPSQGCCLD